MSLTVKAYAKINLWLDITGRRDDGYHTLNTVMRQIDLYDTVEVSLSDNITVRTDCSDIDGEVADDEHNIAYRAAELFYGMSGKSGGADIRIKKRIPLEGGLGGSSTDGAAVLKALNELHGEPFTISELCELGAKLGADVPFCISGGTAKCQGIGEIITPIEGADFAVVVVKPDFSCSTAEAYRLYDSEPLKPKDGFEEFCSNADRTYISRNMYNIFETLYQNSEIDKIKSVLTDNGALGALMTGSGSAVFGIYESIEAAESALKNLPFKRKFAVKAI